MELSCRSSVEIIDFPKLEKGINFRFKKLQAEKTRDKPKHLGVGVLLLVRLGRERALGLDMGPLIWYYWIKIFKGLNDVDNLD